ncbi:MAG: hypothetical protein NTW87_16515 [Planctomycetota bacterium]|nr:hypothetical protein [Planctomycetota bacterium]
MGNDLVGETLVEVVLASMFESTRDEDIVLLASDGFAVSFPKPNELCRKCLVSGIWYPVSGIRHLVSGIRYLASGIRHMGETPNAAARLRIAAT